MKKLIVLISFLLAPMEGLAQMDAQDLHYNYNFGTVFVGTRAFADFSFTAGPFRWSSVALS